MSVNIQSGKGDLIITNIEGWQLERNQVNGRVFYVLRDCWGMNTPINRIILANAPTNTSESPEDLIGRRIKQISMHNNRFGFQVCRYESENHVLFTPYGLAGGGLVEIVVAVSTAAFLIFFTTSSTDAKPKKEDSLLIKFDGRRFLQNWTGIISGHFAESFLKGLTKKLVSNPLVAENLNFLANQIVRYGVQKKLSNEKTTYKDMAGIAGVGVANGCCDLLLKKQLSQFIQAFNVYVVLPWIVNHKNEIDDAAIPAGGTQKMTTYYSCLALFGVGLKLVHEGKLKEGRIVIGSSLNALKYVAFCSEENFNMEAFYGNLMKGAAKSLLSEGASQLITLPRVAEEAMKGLRRILNPEIFQVAQSFIQKMTATPIVDRIFNRTVVTCVTSSFQEYFSGKKFQKMNILVDLFKDNLGMLVSSLIVPSKVNQNMIDFSEFWLKRTQGNSDYNPLRTPLAALYVCSISKQLLNSAVTWTIDNVWSGRKWNENLMQCMVFRSLIGAFDTSKTRAQLDAV